MDERLEAFRKILKKHPIGIGVGQTWLAARESKHFPKETGFFGYKRLTLESVEGRSFILSGRPGYPSIEWIDVLHDPVYVPGRTTPTIPAEDTDEVLQRWLKKHPSLKGCPVFINFKWSDHV